MLVQHTVYPLAAGTNRHEHLRSSCARVCTHPRNFFILTTNPTGLSIQRYSISMSDIPSNFVYRNTDFFASDSGLVQRNDADQDPDTELPQYSSHGTASPEDEDNRSIPTWGDWQDEVVLDSRRTGNDDIDGTEQVDSQYQACAERVRRVVLAALHSAHKDPATLSSIATAVRNLLYWEDGQPYAHCPEDIFNRSVGCSDAECITVRGAGPYKLLR